MITVQKQRGDMGEERAAVYLKRHFWRILERNFRCRLGEIDIIAKNRKYLIFVEVKTRKNSTFAQAREAVTHAKQRCLIAAAQMYLATHPTELQPRFDVIEVYIPDERTLRTVRIEHIENAFET